MIRRLASAGCVALLLGTPAHGGEQEDLLELRNTILNLIGALVEEGVIAPDAAANMVNKAKLDAAEEARQAAQAEQPAPGEVRVSYVPEFVKDEIRAQVRAELRDDVRADILSQAKQERWGIPEALPGWVNKVKFKGDVRLRAQSDMFANSNDLGVTTYLDPMEVNAARNVTDIDTILNTNDDRNRTRIRARLSMDAKVNNSISAGFRLATGNQRDPVSTNQTLGRTGGKYDLSLDRAYLQWHDDNLDGYPWLDVWLGRIPNPWLSTDLVWDSDLSFEGIASTFRYNLAGSDDLFALDDDSRELFLTLGAFPLQEFELSGDDKWLVGGQLGGRFQFRSQSTFDIGLAYYKYMNITGEQNDPGLRDKDHTAPEFMQKGNSLFNISNDLIGAVPDPNDVLLALASDYELLNLTMKYDLARFSPMHIWVEADYVKNIGYDEDEVISRSGGNLFNASVIDKLFEERNEGYQLKLAMGSPSVLMKGNWRLSLAYKYLQRDAVLDAFTDSDFHLGGTDAEGWILGGEYGVGDNAYLTARWLSADEIDGPPLGIDVFQLDLNARF